MRPDLTESHGGQANIAGFCLGNSLRLVFGYYVRKSDDRLQSNTA
jgi:hypothetical protein